MTAGAGKKQASPEFVAVVLASTTGARLFPMTKSSCPKHMLPVAGIPVLYRLLAALEASGFYETVIAVNDDDVTATSLLNDQDEHPYRPVAKNKEKDAVDSNDETSVKSSSPLVVLASDNMKVTVASLSTGNKEGDDCPGSVEALRRMEELHLIPESSNIVVVPGDLVLLDVEPLKKLVNTHRQGFLSNSNKFSGDSTTTSTACTVLLADVGEIDEHTGIPLKESSKQKKGRLARDEEEIDYVALSSETATPGPSSSRLVWKQPKLDVEEDKDMVGATPKLILPKARLRGGGGITRVSTEWNDVHCYCLSPWVRRLVTERTSLLSIQNDLIPLLISRQFRGVVATFGSKPEKQVVEEVLQTHFGNVEITQQQQLRESSSSTNPVSPLARSSVGAYTQKDFPPPAEYAVLAQVVEKTVFRSHSIAAYLYANREFARKVSAIAAVHTTAPNKAVKSNPCLALPKGASVKPKFQTILLADTVTGDKVTFKSSVVGKNCKLGAKCRLNNVVLQDNVTVGDNTILQNTVVGKDSSIAENCNLNDCQVCPGKSLPVGTKKKGEAFIDDM